MRLRFAGLTVAIVADDNKTATWMYASAIPCGWIVIEALSERTVLVPSLYYSFARRGVLGRLAGRVLYPGWASGLLFCSLLTAIGLAAVWIMRTTHHPLTPPEQADVTFLIFPLTFTATVFPVLVLLLFPRVKQPMWLYVLVQAI